MSTSSGSEAWNGSGRGNWGLGRGKESGGNCGSGPGVGGSGRGSGGLRGVGVWGLRGAAGSGLRGVGVWGLGVSGLGVSGLGVWGWRGAGDPGRGSGSARGGASSQDDDVCEAIHAPVGGVSAEGDDDGDGGPIGGVSGDACPRRAEARRRVGTSRVEREEERESDVGEEGGVCAAGAAGRWVG
mgnify:CR=1 FL=1